MIFRNHITTKQAGAARDVPIYLNVGVAARRAGMHEIAVEYLERVMSLDSSNVLARRLLLTLTLAPTGAGQVENMTQQDDEAYARMLFDSDAQGYEQVNPLSPA